jgi:hypothetical protein
VRIGRPGAVRTASGMLGRGCGSSGFGSNGTGLAELLLAVLTGSVGLPGDAIHNLSGVSPARWYSPASGYRSGRLPSVERKIPAIRDP